MTENLLKNSVIPLTEEEIKILETLINYFNSFSEIYFLTWNKEENIIEMFCYDDEENYEEEYYEDPLHHNGVILADSNDKNFAEGTYYVPMSIFSLSSEEFNFEDLKDKIVGEFEPYYEDIQKDILDQDSDFPRILEKEFNFLINI